MKKQAMYQIFLFAAVLLCVTATGLQQFAQASNTCFSTLTAGSGATLVKQCISDHGNVVKFESPAGFDQIGQLNTFRDGYAICTGNLPTTPNVPQGWDAGGEENLFGPSTIIQPHGPNTLPLSIIRDSSSGIYELRQDFSRDVTKRALTTVMTVKRLTTGDCSSSGCPPVRVSRYYEGDVDNNTSANARFAQTADSVWEWVNAPGAHGLLLSNLKGVVPPTISVNSFANFDPNGTGYQTAKGCIVSAGSVATPTDPSTTNAANLYGRVIYVFSLPSVGKSAKFTVVYQRF